jgi:predicted transcriptional regulator
MLTMMANSPTLIRNMELHLTERQQESLAMLSAHTGLSTDDLVRGAVDRMLADEQWFEAQVQTGLNQIARGEFIEEDAMDERVARMLHA